MELHVWYQLLDSVGLPAGDRLLDSVGLPAGFQLPEGAGLQGYKYNFWFQPNQTVWDYLLGTGYFARFPDGLTPTGIYRNTWYNSGNFTGYLCPGDT